MIGEALFRGGVGLSLFLIGMHLTPRSERFGRAALFIAFLLVLLSSAIDQDLAYWAAR